MYRGERFNSISHVIGAVLAFMGLVLLVVTAVQQGDPWKIVSFSIYGGSLLLLYLSSATYHSIRGRAKPILQKCDHLSIYLLIAGSYTPYALITLRGGWGWMLFAAIWSLAVLGMMIEFLPQNRGRIVSLVIYLVMGWLLLIVIKPMLHALPGKGMALLVMGGVFYTSGVIFYALDEKFLHFHGVWHLFVMAGSISHYFSVLFFVV